MQTLKQFQSVFAVEPVRFEFSAFAKDGAFSPDVIKALKAEGLDAIYLRPMTSEQRANFEASVVGPDGKQRDMHNFYARYVSQSWVNDDGKLMGSAKEVGQLRADLVYEIFEKVQKLNGVKTDAVEEAGKG